MRTLVAGIGSTILRDDGVGVHAVRKLAGRLPSAKADIIELGTGGLSLLDTIQDYDRLIIIDAIISGREPGTIRELRGEDIARSVHLSVGHEADLPSTLAIGRRLLETNMPREVIVVTVEALDITTFSEHMSPQVEASLPEVVDCVMKLLSTSPDEPTC